MQTEVGSRKLRTEVNVGPSPKRWTYAPNF